LAAEWIIPLPHPLPELGVPLDGCTDEATELRRLEAETLDRLDDAELLTLLLLELDIELPLLDALTCTRWHG
jgi:hypothetical protein